MTRRELSRILRWRRPSSSLLVLLTRDARHRAPLTTGKAWGHPAFCGYGRGEARELKDAAPPPPHTPPGNLRVLAADREVSDQAEEMWPGRRLDCRTHHWPGQMADVSATAQAGRRLSRLLRRLRRCAAPH